jgi:ribonuclease P protein component
MRQFFGKQERLSSKIQISHLFKDGESFFLHPFRIVFTQVPAIDEHLLKVMFIVSKKHYKKAVQRNHIRRRMREAWRKNRHIFISSEVNGKCMLVALQYVVNSVESYQLMEEKIKLILQRLQKENEEAAD